MKTILNSLAGKIAFLALSIALLSSCQKELPVGPRGPAGPRGANGDNGGTGPRGAIGPAGANGLPGTFKMIVDSFYIAQSRWKQITTDVYQYYYTNPKITQEVLSNAMFQVSSWYPGSGGYWVAWPLSIGNAQYLYYYKLNTVIIQANTSTPPITSFKVVILPK